MSYNSAYVHPSELPRTALQLIHDRELQPTSVLSDDDMNELVADIIDASYCVGDERDRFVTQNIDRIIGRLAARMEAAIEQHNEALVDL